MEPLKRIRVLVVDDSMLARKIIMDGLNAHPRIEVVGYAINAMDAKNKMMQLKPDVMTCDVQMPGLSGIDFLKQTLPSNPLPVVLVSSLNLRVFDALAAGAVDFVRKPDGSESQSAFLLNLTQKIIIASMAKVQRKIAPEPTTVRGVVSNLGGTAASRVIVGLGASTGGTEATLDVLRQLPADCPAMVVVQHMPPGFTKMYAERLNRICAMEVREAVDGDVLQRGLVLVAPADFQCEVRRTVSGKHYVSCKPGEKVSGHRPSVDVLFSSMAKNVWGSMVGIIMTGMGRDGASGLLEMRRRGAFTIGQDKESCVVYGMPAVAYDIGAVAAQVSCANIAPTLLKHVKSL